MYFSACCGTVGDVQRWERSVHSHATWLGLQCRFRSYECLDGRVFSFVYMCMLDKAEFGRDLEPGPSGRLFITTSSAPVSIDDGPDVTRHLERFAQEGICNDIVLSVSLHTGRAEVFVPPASPEQFYYGGEAQAYVLGNDLRLMARLLPCSLSEPGVFALFQYLAVPAPLTLFRGIRCVPAGHVLEISCAQNLMAHRAYFRPAEPKPPMLGPSGPEARVEDVERRVLDLIDQAVSAAPRPSVLLFSGGVDSSLLLTRLVESGADDFHAVNYSFGPRDAEADLALKIVALLGLECEQICYDPSDAGLVLNRIARDYSHPFGDLSVIPTNLLIHGVLRSFPDARSVLDGTAADGLFAVGAKLRGWQWIYRVPLFVKRVAAGVYDHWGLWRGRSRLEYAGRLLKRSAQLPLPQAAIMAQNALDGIAYCTPDHVRERLDRAIAESLLSLGQGLSGDAQFGLFDVVHICARQFAAKSFDPLCSQGVQPVFPFLSPALVKYGLRVPGNIKCLGGEPKGLLKGLLAQRLPPECIYRPKSGFFPPARELLLHPLMQEYLREIVLSSDNPLLRYCRRDAVQEMADLASRGVPLSVGVYNFLWLLIFTSAWLEQVI